MRKFIHIYFNNMIDNTKKTLARESYAAPVCEVLDVVTEGRILEASVDPMSIEDWELDGVNLTF